MGNRSFFGGGGGGNRSFGRPITILVALALLALFWLALIGLGLFFWNRHSGGSGCGILSTHMSFDPYTYGPGISRPYGASSSATMAPFLSESVIGNSYVMERGIVPTHASAGFDMQTVMRCLPYVGCALLALIALYFLAPLLKKILCLIGRLIASMCCRTKAVAVACKQRIFVRKAAAPVQQQQQQQQQEQKQVQKQVEKQDQNTNITIKETIYMPTAANPMPHTEAIMVPQEEMVPQQAISAAAPQQYATVQSVQQPMVKYMVPPSASQYVGGAMPASYAQRAY